MVLLPWPKKVQEQEGNYQLSFDAMIVLEPSCPEGADVYARMLQEEIVSCTGIGIGRMRGLAGKGDIRLLVDPTCFASRYYLNVEEDGILIRGGELSSLGQGVQTLRQLFRQYAGLLPAVQIEDEPDFKTRGFFHDVTRGRVQTLPNLKKMVDTMVFYKLNQLQLYIEHTYLFRGMTELWRDETPLEAQEIMELDAYCAVRGIELVPCLASFGHLYKLLGTRTYSGLCELEKSAGQEFSFLDRMEHHTLNPLNPQSMDLITGMIGEFMQLFSSDKFNICADETFDLGTGKSREAAGKKGRGALYAEFVSGLFEYLVRNGKTPMFWGDIICESPAYIKKFPKETICLAWGYFEQEQDTQVRILHKAGAKLYVCPGTRGWNHFVNQMRESYENIARMCGYGREYHALGVLNTDWGDYGHIGHPDFSIPCMIYGAVFSWGKNVPEFDGMNRMISLLEFGDVSGEFVGYLAQISRIEVFGWETAVRYKEWTQKGRETEGILKDLGAGGMERFYRADERAAELSGQLSIACRSMGGEKRRIAACALLSLRMVVLWNKVGKYLLGEEAAGTLAGELEACLYHYKAYWRENSREGDLARVSDVFFWYADLLREGNGK
ncbi:MAG: beta-N-acetylhexosaminidase [Lachnospiraceae bacterium]|nr:beta-N-acetylhexosaminidase [Lachnospiraceae bacterium]